MEEYRVNLLVPRPKALTMISEHIKKGKDLANTSISSEPDLQDAKAQYRKWRDYAKEMLRQLFNNDSMAKSMDHGGRAISMYAGLGERLHDYRYDFSRDITTLESIAERLPLIPEPEQHSLPTTRPTKKNPSSGSSKIFIVHGHDAAAKSEVARFLEHLGLQPIILHEQANEGKTIIEKIETHSKDTGYAIVILSPDDLGSLADERNKAQPRARQNVVFEWGYFAGLLGRERVNALYFNGVELPTDNNGVVYTLFDENGAWQLIIARELKKAGYDIDMNKL